MRKYLIPSAIFILYASAYIIFSAFSGNYLLFSDVWDVEHYLSISERGYEAFPCPPEWQISGPGEICGNVGWYPLWPILIFLFRSITGLSSISAAITLAFLLTLIFFNLLFRFIESKAGVFSAIIAVCAAAFGPSGFYWLSGFPYALFAVLFMLYLFNLYNRRSSANDVILIFLAVAISLTYPTGLLVAFVPLFFSLSTNKDLFRRPDNLLKLLAKVIPFAVGLLLLWIYFHFKFDNFFIQLDFQSKYGRQWAFPLIPIFESLFGRPILSPENIAILWYGLTFLIFIPYRLKSELWITALVLFLFSPATGSTMSIYRHYLAIIPVYMIIGSSDRSWWLKAIWVISGLIAALGILFPEFISMRLM